MKNLPLKLLIGIKNKTIDFVGLIVGLSIMYCIAYVLMWGTVLFIDLFRY
jgi:hypothetical protein